MFEMDIFFPITDLNWYYLTLQFKQTYLGLEAGMWFSSYWFPLSEI